MALTAEVTHAVAAALNRAVSVDEVAAAIFDQVATALDSTTAGLWLLDEAGEAMHLVSTLGLKDQIAGQVAALEVSDELPVTDALRHLAPVTYSSPAERDRRWPALADVSYVLPAAVVLPLMARDRQLGVLGFGLRDTHQLTEAELSVLIAVSEQCALALDRALLFDAERRARETLEFLADATRLMVSALDPRDVIEQLVDAAVPRLAASCGVFVEHEGRLQQVALRIHGLDDPLLALGDVSFDLGMDHPLTRAYSTGEPVMLESIRDEDVEAIRPGRAIEARAFGITAGLAVPLIARGARLGVVSFSFTSVDHVHDGDLIHAVTGFAARAAIALDNARRFDDEHAALRMLTEALLPPAFPPLEGYELTGRYIAATGSVGGDWYDAQMFPGEALLLGVGDVAGHGMQAAAQMSELRQGARALARWRRRPRVLLTELSRFASNATASFATVAYARIDLATGRGRWASAGHPPALLVHDGEGVFLPAPHGPPLGVSSSLQYRDGLLVMGAGDTLILYTDGVIERRGEPLTDGLERLREVAVRCAGQSVERLASTMVAELCTEPEDDCCFLTLRRGA